MLLFPQMKQSVIDKFSKSSNMWLHRSTIIFQLSYKDKTDEKILFGQCELFKHSDLFFVQKAIGWALREYAKVNPKAVLKFVYEANLKALNREKLLEK